MFRGITKAVSGLFNKGVDAAKVVTPEVTTSAKLDQAISDIASVGLAASSRPVIPHPKSESLGEEKEKEESPHLKLLSSSNKELSSLSGAQLMKLASSLLNGTNGVAVDVERASKLWIIAGGKNHPAAAFIVAICSVDGFGAIPKNEKLAKQLLSHLVERTDNPWVHFSLATLLLRELTSQSVVNIARLSPELLTSPLATEVFQHYFSAANGYNRVPPIPVPPALLNLSNCYAYGVGTERDPSLAYDYLSKAATAGDPLAQATLAEALTHGFDRYGVAKDDVAAAQWWRRAALGGHSPSQHNLGLLYLNGLAPGCEGKPDPAAALVWFKRASQRGVIPAMINAGVLIERNVSDLDLAIEHYVTCLDLLRLLMGLPDLSVKTISSLPSQQGLVMNLKKRLAIVVRNISSLKPDFIVPDSTFSYIQDLTDEQIEDGFTEIGFDSVEARDKALEMILNGDNVSLNNVNVTELANNASSTYSKVEESKLS